MYFSYKVKLEADDKGNSSDPEDFLKNMKAQQNFNSNRNFYELNLDCANKEKHPSQKIQVEDYFNYNKDNTSLDSENDGNENLSKEEEKFRSNYSINYDSITKTKSKFKENINQMKTQTENILEHIRINFNNYIDDQKIHLINSLNTIENLFDVESNSTNCEIEKIKQIEKKMVNLSTEINGLISDLQKFTK
jgi:hypothetical protein